MTGKLKGAEMKKLIAACAFLLCGVFSLTMLFCTAVTLRYLWQGVSLGRVISYVGIPYYILSIAVIAISIACIMKELVNGEGKKRDEKQ